MFLRQAAHHGKFALQWVMWGGDGRGYCITDMAATCDHDLGDSKVRFRQSMSRVRAAACICVEYTQVSNNVDKSKLQTKFHSIHPEFEHCSPIVITSC